MTSRASILLVEDSEDDVFLMKRALKAANIGNPMHVVEDGQEAVNFLNNAANSNDAESELPAVVFLDLKLPVMMGLEVLGWIRSQPSTAHLIVVVLTSSNEPSDLKEAYRLGANSYLVKPPGPDQLLDLARAQKWDWIKNASPKPAERSVEESATISETLAQIKPGDHVALIYRTRREQLACAIPFIKLGLAANERCLYIADGNPVAMIRQHLIEAGVHVDEAEANKSLRILTKNETYLRHGLFDPARIVADLDWWIRESLELGFKGFRAAGEMTWALDLPSSFAALLDYARRLEAKTASQFIGLCQFDQTRFPEAVIDRIVEIHSKVIKEARFLKHDSLSMRVRP